MTDRVAVTCVGTLGALLLQCSAAPEKELTGWTKSAIVNGSVVETADSPVLYLQGQEGACTATLVAPNLAMTARHCIAATTPGAFSCTASGDLVITGSNTGQIGADDDPKTLRFYTAAWVRQASTTAPPEALGTRIVSTQTMTSCRDDLAFVVLDRPISTLPIASIRLDSATQVGERISAWGYGLTAQIEPTALRRSDAQVFGVGPDAPSMNTQSAPLRGIRISSVTCLGDSGGPITSSATGAVIAVVSLGNQASTSGPYCKDTGVSDTVGPRLSAYRQTILAAFAAAGASPTLESTSSPSDAGEPPPFDAAQAEVEEFDAESSVVEGEPEASPLPTEAGDDPRVRTAGGGCAMAICRNAGHAGHDERSASWALALAIGAFAVGAKRRDAR